MKKRRTVFLTGATGLVGSYLLKVLLERGCKVYALARKKNNISAYKRVINTLSFWDKKVSEKKLRDLIVVEGDLIKKDLGIDKSQKNLGKKVEQIFHCAANTQFNASWKDLRLVNVDGTKNLLSVALKWLNRWGQLKKVNYMSTIYICGDYNGRFTEKHLNVGQKFNSYYEESKFQSEVVARKFREKGLWIDIYRPAGITGESKDGKTFQFEHIYQLLRLWSLEVLDIFPLKKTPINLVPVDYVAEAVFVLSNTAQKRNNTFHVFDDRSISPKAFFELAKRLIGFSKPLLIPWSGFNAARFTDVQQSLLKKAFLFYSIAHGKFKSSYTLKILADNGFAFPEINKSYLEKMIKYSISSGFIKLHI